MTDAVRRRGGAWVVLTVLVLGAAGVVLHGRGEQHDAEEGGAGSPGGVRRASDEPSPRAADGLPRSPPSSDPGRPVALPAASGVAPAPRPAPTDATSADTTAEPPTTCDVLARVTADGGAKDGVTVSLFAEPPDDAWRGQAWTPTRHSAITRAEGEATMTGLRPGMYKPVARAAGFAVSASRPFRCRGDGATVEVSLTLERTADCVRGRVVDHDGGPLAHSWALLRDADGQGFGSEIPVAVDQAGRLQACPPATGRWTLLAGAAGHEPMRQVLTGGDASEELVIDLARSSIVEGRVIGPNGPAAGANVTVAGAERKGTRTTVSNTTDTEGRFALSTGAGAATVSAWSAQGWAVATLPSRDEGQDADELVLTLRPGRTIDGRCVDLTGAPCPATPVCFWSDRTGFHGACVTTGDGGRFVLTNVPSGQELQVASPADPATFAERLARVAPDASEVVVVVARP